MDVVSKSFCESQGLLHHQGVLKLRQLLPVGEGQGVWMFSPNLSVGRLSVFSYERVLQENLSTTSLW